MLEAFNIKYLVILDYLFIFKSDALKSRTSLISGLLKLQHVDLLALRALYSHYIVFLKKVLHFLPGIFFIAWLHFGSWVREMS